MFIIDFQGRENLIAQEIPSAVGMRGLAVQGLGEFDFDATRFAMLQRFGHIRPASALPVRRRKVSGFSALRVGAVAGREF
ncbi:hypothetical protein [Xanthobacter sp. 126]|uniref:hypothetical protein n=1 Tax=Xanthobacter sp. 126 TaxID=1131814 RepID=UPI00045E7F4D|nr:hypothetical protein [Xanthobacter sp. 126]